MFFVSGGRMRYRGSSSNNTYQGGYDRRMHAGGGGGGGGGKDSHSSFNRDGRYNHDGDRSTSSFRDRGQDHRNSHNSGSDQYQSYSGGYNSRNGGQSSGGQEKSSQLQGQFGQPPAPPALSGGMPALLPQPFAAQQTLMGFMGQPPYPFAAPPPPPGLPPTRK